MIKGSRIKLLSLAFALVAGLAACDTGMSTDRLTGPQMDVASDTTTYSWNLLAAPTLTSVSENTVVAVIGARGGTIRNGDHMLMIPSKAVTSDTEFTFKVIGGNRVAVDFSARRLSDSAPVSTFPVSLTMRLSYKNVAISDPYRLFNAYVLDGALTGAKQPLPSSISTLTQTVSSQINHFSEYEVDAN